MVTQPSIDLTLDAVLSAIFPSEGMRKPSLWHFACHAAGAQGVISLDTLRLYAALRQLGVKLVVVTGKLVWQVTQARQTSVTLRSFLSLGNALSTLHR